MTTTRSLTIFAEKIEVTWKDERHRPGRGKELVGATASVHATEIGRTLSLYTDDDLQLAINVNAKQQVQCFLARLSEGHFSCILKSKKREYTVLFWSCCRRDSREIKSFVKALVRGKQAKEETKEKVGLVRKEVKVVVKKDRRRWVSAAEGKENSAYTSPRKLTRPNKTTPSPSKFKSVRRGLSKEQSCALEAALAGSNLFITGGGGTGKSHCVRAIYSSLSSQHGPGRVHLTSSTGCGAALIGGITVHSFSGIGIRQVDGMKDVERIMKANDRARKRWKSTKVLIIDEVSMLSCEALRGIEMCARFGKNAPGKVFGGVQVILVG